MAEVSGLMRGKRGLIMGLANNRSIAWGIYRSLGMRKVRSSHFTYQGDALRRSASEPLAC